MANKSSTRGRPGRKNLLDLIGAFKDADAAYGVACTREDKASTKLRRLSPVDHAKAVGGLSNAVTLVVNGKSQVFPASEFYYRSHEEIDRAQNDRLRNANNPAERRAIAADRKRLHAELKRDQSRVDRAIVLNVPLAVRTEAAQAEASLVVASRDFTTARAAILRYRPASALEAAALLQFVAREMVNFNGDADATAIMNNAAKAILTAMRS